MGRGLARALSSTDSVPVARAIDDGSQLKLHPITALFPEMTRNEYGALKADIKARGLIEPITDVSGPDL